MKRKMRLLIVLGLVMYGMSLVPHSRIVTASTYIGDKISAAEVSGLRFLHSTQGHRDEQRIIRIGQLAWTDLAHSLSKVAREV
ncbi:MAG: hypothetical protein OWT28_10580 [Firmicutes bacterium]|nr:hypothetical protein [Bacillota bacterium]